MWRIGGIALADYQALIPARAGIVWGRGMLKILGLEKSWER